MPSFQRIRSINLLVLIVIMLCTAAWQPQKTHAAGGGTGHFTDGGRASRKTTYSYIITGAPPNMCGTLDLYRNDVHETGSNWVCTDSNGKATKGPWGPPTTNETVRDSHIIWADGSKTNKVSHINDVTDPFIRSVQGGGYSVVIPTEYNGTASDAKWGTGFDYTPFGWTGASATYKNVTTGKYYTANGYDSSIPSSSTVQLQPCCSGFNITWRAWPPPPSAHNSTDTYRWCVNINDFFYNGTDCITFTGPR